MASRVSQTNKEIVGYDYDPSARVTQANAEVVNSSGSPRVRVTQANAEVAETNPSPRSRLTQTNVEILVWATSKLIWDVVPIAGGDVPSPTVLLSPPPPPPVFYLYPSGGARVLKYKPKAEEADRRLKSLEKLWEDYSTKAVEGSGLSGLGRVSNGSRWVYLGRQRRPFFKQGSIITPPPAAGDVNVVSFEVPEGYFGFLSGFWWSYTGTGYVEGGPDIEWRIRIADYYPEGYGRVRFQMGSPSDPLTITGVLPLRSRQTVSLVVLVRNDSGSIAVGSSRIIGGLTGWLYEPEKAGGGVLW